VLIFALFALPFPLYGQTPGQRIPSRERVHAEFINNIMGGINEARADWMDGIEADDLDAVMATYADGATVIPFGGEPVYGKEAIRTYWEEVLPSIGPIRSGLGDMDASGQMAMAAGTYSVEGRQENGAVVRESGGLLTVFVQRGREWLIRAQVFGAPTSG
jgi:ketosteroid isomerase-like protein